MLSGSKVGTMDFNNLYVDWKVPNLDLDAVISSSILPVLETKKEWTVVDSGSFVEDFKNLQEPYFNVHSHLNVPKDYLLSVRDAGFNGLIVYLPDWSFDDLTDTNQEGIGVFHRSLFGIKKNWYVAVGKIHLYDLQRPEIDPAVFKIKVSMKSSGDFAFANTWEEFPYSTKRRIILSVKYMIRDRFPEQIEDLLERIQDSN